jgi:iron complex transport system substrate-binding protein
VLKKKNVIIASGLLAVLLLFAACGGNAAPGKTPDIIYDREGNPVFLLRQINNIISIAPSNTEILIALGFGDAIVAADDQYVTGIAPDIAVLNMSALNLEHIISLNPDLVVTSSMILLAGDNPLSPLSDLGVAVAYIPSSDSIAGIMEDIRFIAAMMNAGEAGEEIISAMQAEIDEIRKIAEAITETRTVYVEISPAPWMFSFGTGTFLHEMVELVGAVNVFANQESWISVTGEALLEANPDVILTLTDFLDDPVAEIMERPGFGVITAIRNGDVFQIDAISSQRPSHNIVKALREIAEAVFPEYFR